MLRTFDPPAHTSTVVNSQRKMEETPSETFLRIMKRGGVQVRRRRYVEGDRLLSQGEVSESVYFAATENETQAGIANVHLCTDNSKSRSDLLWAFPPGKYITGLQNIESQNQYPAWGTYRVTTNCFILVASMKDVRRLVQTDPEMALWVCATLAAETERAKEQESITSFLGGSIAERMNRLPTHLIEMGLAWTDKDCNVRTYCNQDDLASILFVARESVTKGLHQLISWDVSHAKGMRLRENQYVFTRRPFIK